MHKAHYGRTALLAGAAALAICSLSAPAIADPISTDTWYTFGFGGAGSPLGDAFSFGFDPLSVGVPTAPWTITLASPEFLTVTDLEISGDFFTFSDFGTIIGTTGNGVDSGSTGCSTDISCALADSNYGKGVFLLSAGDHSLTGIENGDIFSGDGAFIISAVSPIPAPEPITLSIFGAGLAGAVAVRRRKKSRT